MSTMPRRDGTGPMGFGQSTGRCMGRCAGIGLSLGLGCRNGFRRWSGRNADTSLTNISKSEKELLLEEIKYLKDRVEAIDKKAEDQ
ncbi:MAG: DUF5320 domain-containing protein [Synergistaceae bacterium]|nr:DUF5320 domain-containing protein [Synergistaceae bacterium]